MRIDVSCSRKCPKCQSKIVYNGRWAKYNCERSLSKLCKKCCMTGIRVGVKNPLFGKKYDDNTRHRISEKCKVSIKKAMHRPDVRRKHLEALSKTKWLKVKTDVGQLELLEKWNRLGFRFEPNFQVRTENDLFYVDGYDPINKVVIEYDGKYHQTPWQKKKDFERQIKVIDALKPKKFWRYDATHKHFSNVM